MFENITTTLIAGIPVTCLDTGVTESSVCGNLTFFHNTAGTKSYSTPGGAALFCPRGHGSVSGGSASEDVSTGVSIIVNVQPGP